MSEPASPAAMKPPSLDPPRRAPKVFITATWPFFLFVGTCVAVASLINSFSILTCERAEAPGGGMCHLDRGSMAFNYRESFFVDDLTGARLNDRNSDITINRRDLGGERIYLQVGNEQHRIIDNGALGVAVSSQTGFWATYGDGLADVGTGDVGATDDIAITIDDMARALESKQRSAARAVSPSP